MTTTSNLPAPSPKNSSSLSILSPSMTLLSKSQTPTLKGSKSLSMVSSRSILWGTLVSQLRTQLYTSTTLILPLILKSLENKMEQSFFQLTIMSLSSVITTSKSEQPLTLNTSMVLESDSNRVLGEKTVSGLSLIEIEEWSSTKDKDSKPMVFTRFIF